MNGFRKPILFLLFNRPDTTKQVFEVIKKVRPEKLYIAADGARPGKPGEDILCAETRSIVDEIDWPCTVKKLFRTENLGCRLAVSGAISWFFEHEEMGMILEDDCLPDLSFFSYCDYLLDFYKEDERIMHIGGTNFQDGCKGNASYYFSSISHVWGWASWRRAWNMYDSRLDDLEEMRERELFKTIVPDNTFRKNWFKIFTEVRDGKINTWDFQWLYSIWKCNGLSIIPNTNLVSNIGFGPDATHTVDSDSIWANSVVGEMKEIVNPEIFRTDISADEYTMRKMFNEGKRFWIYFKKITSWIRRLKG